MSKVLVLSTLMLGSCAFSQAMRNGDRAAAAGDWQTAYDAYSAALETKPGSDDAKNAQTLARDEAADDAIEMAEGYLELREYEKVSEQLAYINSLDRDRPEVFSIKVNLGAVMKQDYERTWEADSYRRAYELAALTKKLLPGAEYLDDALPQCRAHFTESSKALLKQGKHEEALAAIQTITELEPERKGDVTALEQDIRTDWADALTKSARTHAKYKRLGAASVLFARAYEIAGRRPDIEESRELAGTLRTDGQFTLRLQISGAAERAGPLEETIERSLVGITDAALSDESAADLTMKVTVARQRCVDTKDVTPSEKEYVSGQVEKPNVVWHDLTDQRAKAQEDEAVASERVAELEPQVKAAEITLADFEKRMTKAQVTFDSFQGKIDLADSQLRAAQEMRDTLTSQLSDMREHGNSPEGIAQWEEKLADQGKRITEWQGVVLQHQDNQSESKRELDALAVERGPAAEAVERLKSGYDSVVKDRNEAQQSFATLTAQLAKTDKTIWEDVYSTFAYDVIDWTRSCTSPVTVAMSPRWETSKETSREFSPMHSTTDSSHVGMEKADIKLDEKIFPESDADLVAKGDATTGNELVEWVAAMADDHFRQYTLDTIIALQEAPEKSTTDLVSLYVGAPGRLDDQTLGTFSAHLKQHYGLEKIELLRGGGAAKTQ